MHETRPTLARIQRLYMAIDDAVRWTKPQAARRGVKLKTPEEPDMLNFIKTFRADEDGAVTVDWVVLTAAVVGLGIVVLNSISDDVSGTADDIAGAIAAAGDKAATDLN